MIIINQAPDPGSVILDANNTIISISSSNGIGYYFRVKIFIEDILFDEQGWSRKDNFTAEKDLKKLYNAYFKTIFEDNFTTGIFEQNNLKKKVVLEFEERLLSDDSLVTNTILPPFFILYANKPSVYNYRGSFVNLANDSDFWIISKNGKIAMPFSVFGIDLGSVIVMDNFGNLVSIVSPNQIYPNNFHIFLLQIDFSSFTIPSNVSFIILDIWDSTSSNLLYSKTIRIFNKPNFPIKEIVFLNNFGFYQYAYLDGQMAVESQIDTKTYTKNDNSEVAFEISENLLYSINSGMFLNSEKNILYQIATSLKTKIFQNGLYYDMVSETKKITRYKDRNSHYVEKFIFSIKNNQAVASPIVFVKQLMIIDFVKTSATEYTVTFFANYDLTSLKLLTHSGNQIYTQTPLSGINSPQVVVFNLPISHNNIQLIDNGAVDIYSNVFIYQLPITLNNFSTGTFSDNISAGLNKGFQIDFPYFSNLAAIKWQANYQLVAVSYTAFKVALNVMRTNGTYALSWNNDHEVNGSTSGNHITPIRNISLAGLPFTSTPITFWLSARTNHSIDVTFWFYDINNDLIGSVIASI